MGIELVLEATSVTERITLSQFIEQEISARQMSGRKFAEFVGVDNATIVRQRDTRKPQEPSVGFLIKLAKATGVSIQALVAMVAPEDVSNIDPRALLIAERITHLEPVKRQQAEAFLLGLRLQLSQEIQE
jgi:transcriptional regulator with XRE-family HTH domain